MMLRRVSDQARAEGSRALQRALDGVRGHTLQRPAVRRARTQDAPVADEEDPVPDEAMPDEATKALNRIADTIDRIAVQLDAHQQERAEQFDAIEFLMREMVIGTALPTAARPSTLGGVIETDAANDLRAEIRLDTYGYALEIETAVEVRSRFHDRWICGFTISEVVGGPDRFRYRLTRRSDGIPLPILFEPSDVRAAAARPEWQRAID
jgi:hypothetical protein